MALEREISICSVFLVHNNSSNAVPLLNRQRKFASGGSVHGGELPWSYFFFSPEPSPSTHEQYFPGLLGLNALAHTSPVFQKEKERENQQNSQEQPG